MVPYHDFMPILGNVTERPNNASKATEHTLAMPASPDEDFWYLHVDGASNFKGSEASIILITLDDSILEHAITLGFKVSKNDAEYEALLAGLQMAKNLAMKKVATHSDS
ncbi:hypothetical protein ACFX2A_012923 [Malus domestica]